MRFFDKGLSVQDVVSLIDAAADAGVTSHHSSSEYSSYDLYVEALKHANCRSNISHIAKVAAPHFEDDKFCRRLLEERVDRELTSLNIDCIDVLQWLLRSKPINDVDRLKTLANHRDEIEDVFESLKQKGKVKSVYSFPYSVEFARQVLKLDAVDGLTAYLNNEEQEYSGFAETVPFIAIRPLFAGKLVANVDGVNDVIANCMRSVFSNEYVSTAIVGINTVQQLDAYRSFA